MFEIEDHASVGDQLLGKPFWQFLRGDDERANGDNLLLQILRDTPRVTGCADQNRTCVE